jgi:hypothetical protein
MVFAVKSIENPEPVPPIDAEDALNRSPTEYPVPAAVIVTLVITLPETTIVACALDPVPPVNGTVVYVPFTYDVPALTICTVTTPPVIV